MSFVVKRNGENEEIHFDKITKRIESLVRGPFMVDGELLSSLVDIDTIMVAKQVVSNIYNGVKTTELDIEAARIAHSYTIENPDYSILAARILVSSLHKETPSKFSEAMSILNENEVLNEEFYDVVCKNASILDNEIKNINDFVNYDYFGFKTLEGGYLTQVNKKIVERPQYMLMRVAVALNVNNIEKALLTYKMLSNKMYTHATPTLFHAGMKRNQCSSCFLVYIPDSIEGIFDGVKQCALCSKFAGGVGIHVSGIRANGAKISGTHGTSGGLIPWLKIFNETFNAVDQGGRRKGSCAVYLSPDHPDFPEFLEIVLNDGNERERCRDLFIAVWNNMLFMKRAYNKQTWSFFCPMECPDLQTLYGKEYEKRYKYYEEKGIYKRQMSADSLLRKILEVMSKKGLPYMVNKDSANERNNQSNLGTLKGSNLCAEILIYTDENETGTCNLASVAVCQFVKDKSFDFKGLYEVVRLMTYNLNRVIDINYYPTEQSRNSNMKHRPIAIGVMGLWDTFMRMGYDFVSEKALDLNVKIFETMYYAFVVESNELAKVYGSYSSFEGSPMSEGKFQFDLWNESVDSWNNDNEKVDNESFWNRKSVKLSGMYDWNKLRESVVKYGMRNSLGIALMPTASTSNIMGFSECFECITTNQYVRRTKVGEFYIINQYLYNDLKKINMWTKEMRDKIMLNEGSIQEINEIPESIRLRYKTAYEQDGRKIIDLSVARAPFIDHTESHNIYIKDFTYSKMATRLFYSTFQGLKTNAYYTRQQGIKGAVKFALKPLNVDQVESPVVELESEGCAMCE